MFANISWGGKYLQIIKAKSIENLFPTKLQISIMEILLQSESNGLYSIDVTILGFHY